MFFLTNISIISIRPIQIECFRRSDTERVHSSGVLLLSSPPEADIPVICTKLEVKYLFIAWKPGAYKLQQNYRSKYTVIFSRSRERKFVDAPKILFAFLYEFQTFTHHFRKYPRALNRCMPKMTSQGLPTLVELNPSAELLRLTFRYTHVYAYLTGCSLK